MIMQRVLWLFIVSPLFNNWAMKLKNEDRDWNSCWEILRNLERYGKLVIKNIEKISFLEICVKVINTMDGIV